MNNSVFHIDCPEKNNPLCSKGLIPNGKVHQPYSSLHLSNKIGRLPFRFPTGLPFQQFYSKDVLEKKGKIYQVIKENG